MSWSEVSEFTFYAKGTIQKSIPGVWLSRGDVGKSYVLLSSTCWGWCEGQHAYQARLQVLSSTPRAATFFSYPNAGFVQQGRLPKLNLCCQRLTQALTRQLILSMCPLYAAVSGLSTSYFSWHPESWPNVQEACYFPGTLPA